MRQVTKMIVHAFSYAIYKEIYGKFRERCAELRQIKIQNESASMLQFSYRLRMARYGATYAIRQLKENRNFLNMSNTWIQDLSENRGMKILRAFSTAASARNGFMKKLKNFPNFVDHFKVKAFKARKSLKRKRNFLSRIFQREKQIMLKFYQGKKKNKKLHQKLQNMKDHNMHKILDDYFWGVCYEYYKRQLQIFILLQTKYLRTSQINVENNRRFTVNKPLDLKSLSSSPDSPVNLGSENEAAGEE